MKLYRKNKSLYNQPLKRPTTSNTVKNLNLIPSFIQTTKKTPNSKKKDEIKNQNLNINNISNNKHSNSSLHINFLNKESLITSVDNSKEKILSYNSNNNKKKIFEKNKNKNIKKYPKTALNSRKNSVDKRRNNKSLLQKCENKIYINNKNHDKNSIKINSNRNNNNINNNKIKFSVSNFNNYINNSKLTKNLNKKNNVPNLAYFLYNTNNINKFNKKNISITHTAKVSPAVSFIINNNSKSLKSINYKNIKEEKNFMSTLKQKSKMSEIIKNINILEHNDNNIGIKKKKNNNSLNNFYSIINNNNIPNNNNNNVNNSININNFENILNNCQTTSGALYNNYNININNLINNHIIYNNNNINSRKKLNLANLINKKINRIISQSQQEILNLKKNEKNDKNIKKHFTSNNSPNRIFNYKMSNAKNQKKNNFFFNNIGNYKQNKTKNNNKIMNKNIKIFNGLRNTSEKKNSKIKSKSTEKLNMQQQIKTLKNELNNNNITNIEESKKEINIYMAESLNLTEYIKNFYKKNKKYPQTNLNFYKYGRLIGQGAFGKVNLGLNVLTGRVVAIKSFNKKNFDVNNDFMKKIIYETNLMKKLNHKNVTKILEMFEDDKYILIIMEYINGGNLFSFVKKRRKLTEKISKFLFRQIILGLKHIHSKNIVHRDVKLENILIDLNNTIKICDFGIGRVLSSPQELLHDQCGTPMYMAPEILFSTKEKGYKGFPVDIWSAGIALYIMLSGTLPFSIKKEDSILDMNENNKKKNVALKQAIMFTQPKKIEKISDKAKDLLHGLLNKDPNKRLTIEQILKHPWLNEDENDIINYNNYNGINNIPNNKYHLFTKAEIIMLSKTYIDYRKAKIEDMTENFTISNLKKEKEVKTLKNDTSKSFILTPYNSILEDDTVKLDINDFDDMNNSKINLENDIISYNNKVKEYNMFYELNNNNEVDNGMLKNSKINTLSSSLNQISEIKTESVLCFEEDTHNKIILVKNEEKNEKNKDEKILDKIEKMGFDKKYVKECLNNNILCHATTVYFLLMNYDNL